MAQKPLPEDFKDFIKYLNVNKVKYLLLGGWAVGIHGNPRATKERKKSIGRHSPQQRQAKMPAAKTIKTIRAALKTKGNSNENNKFRIRNE